MRAVVAGSGVDGYAAALALERAGLEVTLVDAGPVPGAVHVWADGMRVLSHLGVAAELIAARPVTIGAQFRTHTGRLLAEWDLERHRGRLGAPTLGVPREALVRALARDLHATTLVSGRAVGFTPRPRGVELGLHGGDRVRGDLLVAADGAGSAVAAQVRAGARPARIGVPVAHGIADAPARAPESGLLTEWWGPRQRFVCFETGPAQWSWVSVGATRTQGWDATVAALIAATPADARWHAGPVRVARGGAWTRGRVALLGEAAHPSGGSGGQDAAQALLDAAALSRALATHPDVEVALSAYAGARRPAATRQQALAARLDRLGRLGGPLSCRLREWLIRLTWEQVALPQLVRSLAPDAGELATPTTSGSLPAHSA